MLCESRVYMIIRPHIGEEARTASIWLQKHIFFERYCSTTLRSLETSDKILHLDWFFTAWQWQQSTAVDTLPVGVCSEPSHSPSQWFMFRTCINMTEDNNRAFMHVYSPETPYCKMVKDFCPSTLRWEFECPSVKFNIRLYRFSQSGHILGETGVWQ